jgi:hypothetical protein
MSLVTKLDLSIIKGISRTQLREICKTREEFDTVSTYLRLNPNGVVEKIGYVIGYLIERT